VGESVASSVGTAVEAGVGSAVGMREAGLQAIRRRSRAIIGQARG
jgi:hypothetical protein